MISFNGSLYPKENILHAVFLIPECGFLSQSCLEELFDEKGIKVDHATTNRKVVRYPSSVYDGRGQRIGLAQYDHGRCKAR